MPIKSFTSLHLHNITVNGCNSNNYIQQLALLISLAILCSPILSNAVANDVHVGPPLLVTLSSLLSQAARHS